MVAVDTPCPQCDCQPIHRHDLVDGTLWACPACEHQELSAGVDIESQMREFATYDPVLAADWCTTLGIDRPCPGK